MAENDVIIGGSVLNETHPLPVKLESHADADIGDVEVKNADSSPVPVKIISGNPTEIKVNNAAADALPIEFVDEAGAAYGVKHVQNKIRVSSMPYLYDIAEGNVTGHTTKALLGYNGAVGATEEDIWEIGGLYTFPPATGVAMDVVSSGQDKSDGSGVRTVKIWYLDVNFIERTTNVTLTAGTVTGIASGALIRRVNDIRALTCGTGGKAAATINVTATGTPATIYRNIPAGLTRGRSMIYTVPAGKTFYITSVMIGSSSAHNSYVVRFTARANVDDQSGISALDFFMPYFEGITSDNSFSREFEMPMGVPEKIDFKLSAISPDGSTICQAACRGWVE